MRIVICHNYFRERGGEDQVFEDELELLTSYGHDVATFTKHNDSLDGVGNRIRVAVGAPWNRSAAAELEQLVRKTRAEIVHFHNWLPQISPAGFYAARRSGAAVIQTLHNYRWACPKGILFREGKLCEKCLGKNVPWPAVRHSCYRDSAVGSGFVSATLGLHNALGTTRKAVDSFIAPEPFIKEKMASAGIPRDRIFIKPNFLTEDPGPGPGGGGYMLYLGRLSPEKKIDTLLAAWELLAGTVPLKISGTGPLRPMVEAAAARDSSIEYLGFAPDEALDDLVGGAQALVLTSGTYEAQPMVILQSYAKGTPVIASRLGAMSDLIEDGATGWHFTPSDANDLARVVSDVFADPGRAAALRKNARDKFLANYLPDSNHERMMEIYETTLSRRRAERQENQ